jgi:hypothetical protein
MNNTDDDKKLLSDMIAVGTLCQAFVFFVEQAFVLGKEETIKSLGGVFQQFVSSLSQEEKEQFDKEMNTVLKNKGEAIGDELAQKLSPEELEAFKKELSQLITNPPTPASIAAPAVAAPQETPSEPQE